MVNGIERQSMPVEQPMPRTTTTKPTESVKKLEIAAPQEKGKQLNEKLPRQEAAEMAESMNKFLTSADSRLKFVLHDELETYYVTIIDKETDEVIREIPSETLMNIRAAMKEFVGLLIDQKI